MSTTAGAVFHCCKRTFKTARALEQHLAHSPRHAENVATSSGPLDGIVVKPREKVECLYGRTFESTQQNDSPGQQKTKTFDLSASVLDRGYSPFYGDWDRDEGVSLTDAAGGAGKEVPAKSTEKRKRGRRSAGREERGNGVTSGRGHWYPDVGDNHGLCDSDCGWCGHCVSEAGF